MEQVMEGTQGHGRCGFHSKWKILIKECMITPFDRSLFTTGCGRTWVEAGKLTRRPRARRLQFGPEAEDNRC